MDMVDLVVVVCSLLGSGTCQERHMLFESHGSLQACMIEAPPYLARWIGEHPNLRVSRWHCAWPDSEKQGI